MSTERSEVPLSSGLDPRLVAHEARQAEIAKRLETNANLMRAILEGHDLGVRDHLFIEVLAAKLDHEQVLILVSWIEEALDMRTRG